jgi:hypothetical protein
VTPLQGYYVETLTVAVFAAVPAKIIGHMNIPLFASTVDDQRGMLAARYLVMPGPGRPVYMSGRGSLSVGDLARPERELVGPRL